MKITKCWFTNEKTTCDCCGQYITNVYHVEYSNGEHKVFGSSCIEKQYKKNHSKKEVSYIKSNMKTIKKFQKELKIAINGHKKEYNQYGGNLKVPQFEDSSPWNEMWYNKTLNDWKNFKIKELTQTIGFWNNILKKSLNDSVK